MREQLGAFLVYKSLITPGQLDTALKQQKRLGGRLGATLISLRYITPAQLLLALAEYFDCPSIDLSTYNIEPHLIEMLTPEMARGVGALPVREGRDAGGRKLLYVAMRQPDDLRAVDQLAFATNYAIQPMVALDGSLNEAVEYFYQGTSETFATFDGRERLLSFEETSPDTLDHFYSEFDDTPPPAPPTPPPSESDDVDAMIIELSDSVDPRTYLKFLIKMLLRKGILTREDVSDLLRK